MGAMVMTLLGLLCFFLAMAGALPDSELCLGWLPVPVEGLQPFHCPQRPDGTDGPFCCGTCTEPYCCGSEENRLDQDQCLQVWKMLHLFFRYMMAQKTTTTFPTSDSQTRESAWSPSKTNTELSGPVISAIACAVIVVICVVAMFICKCCPCMENCEICRRIGRRAEPPPPSPPEWHYHIPPSESTERTREKLLRELQAFADLLDASRAMAAASAGPGTRRRARGPEGEATQAPTTSGATSDTAAAREVTPESGAAAGGEDPPVQGAAGGGEEAASPLVSPAPIST